MNRIILILLAFISTQAFGQIEGTITVRKKDACEKFEIPSSFSPDNDSIMDQFIPVELKEVPKYYKLEIYDMIGEKVFQTFDYKKGWDGKIFYLDNLHALAADYSYNIVLKCQDNRTRVKKGVFELTRKKKSN